MNLWGDIVNLSEEYENEVSKNILNYTKDNIIYSDEPYEFKIIGGTPDGRIIVPDKMVYIPTHIKKVIVKKDSVIIKNSKIVSINEVTVNNNKYIEVKINYMVSFNIKLYDMRGTISKIRCYLDKYPMPNRQSFIKEFIRGYSIVTSKILINNEKMLPYETTYDPKVYLFSEANVDNINLIYKRERKYTRFYDVNREEYIKAVVGITITNQVKIVHDKDPCKEENIKE